MRPFPFRLLTISVLSMTLLGCVPEDALVEAGMSEPPGPQLVDGVYVASSDNGFTIPAVPVEKVPQQFQRQQVYYETAEPVGTVIISPGDKHLYLVTGKNRATQYGISVGRAGFEWAGVANVTGRKTWPTWTPPAEMIDRRPELAKWEKGQPGGPTNPLGARALYLTTNGVDYGYRIHGTPEWESIGHNASSGCIRMINQDVMDLYNRVPDGAKVVVLNVDGSYPSKLKLPPKAPAKKKPAPAVTPEATPVSATGTAATAPLDGSTPPAATPVAVAPLAAPPAVLLAPPATLPAAASLPAAPVAPAEPACAEALVDGTCPPPKTTP